MRVNRALLTRYASHMTFTKLGCSSIRKEVISRTEAFEDLCTLVEHFRRSFGSVLQGKLRELHYSNPNYMSKILLDSHLKDRKPVAVNHNSVYVFKQCSLGTGYNDSVLRAANLVYSSLRFLESLRRNKLRPDIHHTIPTITNSGNFEHLISILPSFLATQGAHLFKAFPLDMSHYKCMFHSTRIPDFGIDRLETYPEARHVVVLSRGEFYTFDAFDDQNKMVSAEQLVSNFAFIRNRPRGSTEKPSVGLLTTMNRNCAALARQRLRQVDGDTEGINTRNLALIDAAIMVLIMCDAFSEYLPQLVSTTLAGPGGSRWFDKSFSLLVDRSGTAALNFDCGWTDASTALRFAESIFRDSETRPSADPWLLDSPHRLPGAMVRRLEWHLDEAFYEKVLLPQRDAYDALRDSLQVDCLAEMGDRTLTRRLCVRAGVCADAMMQLAFLMAHEKVHGEAGLNGGSTESHSTRTFRGGYTTLLRPFTIEMREFLRLFRLGDIVGYLDEDDLLDALHCCSRAHQKLLREAAVAQDWDSHLFALKQLAEAEGKKLPEFFTNKAYERISTVDLYTAPLTSGVANAATTGTTTGLLIGAFAPTSPHGYGISYGITDEGCSACFTTWRDSSISKGSQFVESFRQSLHQIAAILQS
uniref:Carnitine O palmitoyltransferase 2 n=1 Tax=Echinococcus granulosus TaxID=6210 RepID=A0A068WJR1_ECHGR|nr:carnitine O palmitoyltransferase 2 [Echinococcus granulosus]